MKKLLFFSAMLLLVISIKAQNTFYKVIDSIAGETVIRTNATQTSDGGYTLLGTTTSAIFLVKTDVAGNTLWTKTYRSDTITRDYSYRAASPTADQGWIVVGTKRGISDIYVLKIDATGGVQWEKFIGNSSRVEVPQAVLQTSDGGYVITALQNNSPSSLPPLAYMLKLDAGGAVQWNTILSIPGQGNNSGNIYSAIETNDGGYVLAGEADTIASNKSMGYLLKLNHTGTLQWSKLWGGTNGEGIGNVLLTADNGFLICGKCRRMEGIFAYSDMTITKTDSAGNVSWGKTYVKVQGLISKTSGSNVLLSAMDENLNMLFGLIDLNGNILWNRTILDAVPDPHVYVHGVSAASQTNDGGYLVIGGANGSGITKTYFIKTDAGGSTHCSDSTVTITVNPYTPTETTPVVSSSTGFSTGTVTSVVSSGVDFITTYCTTTGIEENQGDAPSIAVYPNPSAGIFHFSGLEKESVIQITDLSGRNILKTVSMNDSETIDLGGKAKGIYFYTIIKNNRLVQRGKVIID